MSISAERLIVALDVPDAAEARRLVDELGDSVVFYKIGMQLYFAEGNDFVRDLKARGKKIFLDLKINDIPETVAKAVESVSRLGVDYLTLFTGAAQIKAARETLVKTNSAMKLLNVTVLTSEISDFTSVKVRAELSLEAGAHGLICSGRETRELRQLYGHTPILVNPGIRPLGAGDDDQIRIVTPTMAIEAGATNIVVGRPITRATDVRSAAEAIQIEIAAAHATTP